MVYIVSWDDFVERSVQLFRNSPQNTRYVMKYRHSDGKLVLKVTDDKEGLFLLDFVDEFSNYFYDVCIVV
ncbi:putative signal recognition particle, SRP9/SRP14 subunit, signal recognition particle SRP9 [Helianthus annuus]|nr:putative signal recognition particle, SRP9/SRP14 subunit, signal recognition particle SRP9 [Helianthus annuus]